MKEINHQEQNAPYHLFWVKRQSSERKHLYQFHLYQQLKNSSDNRVTDHQNMLATLFQAKKINLMQGSKKLDRAKNIRSPPPFAASTARTHRNYISAVQSSFMMLSLRGSIPGIQWQCHI